MKPLVTTLILILILNSGLCQDCTSWLNLQSYPSRCFIGNLNVTGNAITCEAEINLTQAYTGGSALGSDIVGKYSDPSDANYLLRAQNAQITTDNGFFETSDLCPIQINKTYHVAMVYDGATLKYYRNGFLISQVNATGNLVQNNWLATIGYYQYAFYNVNFIGYINEVRIWNVARTQAQIQAYMNTSLPSPTTQTGLLAYYQFNSLTNLQGNPAWNGVLSGAAAIGQTNPQCPFIMDNDCCAAISGSLTGNSTCPDGTGQLIFHPTTPTINSPYTLVYNYQGNTYTQPNVSDNIPFPVSFQPSGSNEYDLTKITDADLCTTNITGTAATITVLQPAELTITPDTKICEHSSLQLNVSGGSSFAWNPMAGLDNPNVPNPMASPSVPTMYYVTGRDPNNCLSSDSVMIDFLPKPVFTAPSDQTTCADVPLVLDGGNGTANHYAWSPGADLDDATSPHPVATLHQTTQFQLVVSDPVCTGYDSVFNVQVRVNPSPTLVLNKSNDVDCSNSTTTLTATGAEDYQWSPASLVDKPGNSSVVAFPSQNTSFLVQAKDANGCAALDSITVFVSKKGESVFSVPNAFTPNNDHVNDCFGIRKWGQVNLLEFSIYNRWGQKIFESRDPSACWDGTFQGELQPSGGYVYVIRASSFCSENILRTGTVLLIR